MLSKKRQKPGVFMRTLKRIPESIAEKDNYGYPITFNYKGSDTYQTVPGGILSIVFSLCVFSYFLMRGKQMVFREEWSLVT